MRPRLATALEGLALALACLTLLWGPLAQGSTFGWGMSGLTILGCLTFALTLLALGMRGQVRVTHPWWVGAALAFLAWVWASTGWAAYQWEAWRWAGVWTAVLGTALSLHLLARTRRSQSAVLTVSLLAAAASVTVALLQERGITLPGYLALPGTPEKYLTGPYFHPSHFSGYLIVPAALVSTVLLCTRPGWLTLPLLALAVGIQYVNLKTDGSSIPAVMLAALIPVVVWAWTKRAWLGAVLTLLALAAGGSGLYLLATPQGQALFAQHKAELGIHSQNLEGFLDTRRAIHRFPLEMWRDHPVTGTGVAQFPSQFFEYRRPVAEVTGGADRVFVNYAHSDYLQLLAELGTVGLALFLLMLLFSVARRPRGLAALAWPAMLATFLCTGLYDSHLTAIPGTMLAALALSGLPALPRQAAGKEEPELEGEAPQPPAELVRA
ncbi:O-antigen ligase family protein [Deinococcus apachensis]|uniref:O-antigen ligase family protein n=1 Tax=Deinococcus apachensis TaxID=309886 RepID=UPI000369C718|nr:O-antigen ligase family protein [Deinococcus apachensis]